MQAEKLNLYSKFNFLYKYITFKIIFNFYGGFNFYISEKDKMTNFYDDKMIFAQRIGDVVELLGTPNAAAKKAGVTASSIARWLKGEADPSRTNLIRLAEAANVNIAWLATGEGDKFRGIEKGASSNISRQKPLDVLDRPVDIDEFVFIPHFDIEASAKHGSLHFNEEAGLVMPFRRYWITNYLNANPKDLSVIRIKGDSMQGVLNNGDNVLINHNKIKPQDGLFVLRIDGGLFAKRLQVLPDGKLLIKSANKEYESFIIDLKSPPTDFQIIGAIEWFGRQINNS